MSDRKYITVLDFTLGEVFQYKIPKVFTGSIPWHYEDYEDFLVENTPIPSLHTHSYGFHTANGRGIIERMQSYYYEFEKDNGYAV